MNSIKFNPDHFNRFTNELLALTIYEKNYVLITNLLPFLKIDEATKEFEKLPLPEYLKIENEGFMPLNYDLLQETNDFVSFALSHTYVENGDIVTDIDMVLKLHKKMLMIEALSYQDRYTYNRVYERNQINVELKPKLNKFLYKWLRNLRRQGYKIDN